MNLDYASAETFAINAKKREIRETFCQRKFLPLKHEFNKAEEHLSITGLHHTIRNFESTHDLTMLYSENKIGGNRLSNQLEIMLVPFEKVC